METTYLAETDHLGSLVGLTDTAGVYEERYSYDAWGRRRNPTDWSFVSVPAATITDRGFTGHEHLDEFRLINMGGRLFDPLTSRFLNSDPVIDSRGTAQGLNSYTYCLNNPLKYTDPTGYILDGPMEEITFQNPGWLRYAGGGHSSSSWFEAQFEAGSEGGGGGGAYGKPGQDGNGTGLGGIYYDHVSGTYRDTETYEVVSQDVFINVIERHRDYQVTWLYYSGPENNPYLRLTGFSLSDGTTVDFIDYSKERGSSAVSTISISANFVSVIANALHQTLTSTKIGSDIAYYLSNSNLFIQAAECLKPLWYGAAGISFVSDIYLSANGQQPWKETGLNSAVAGTAFVVGGWLGIVLQANYLVSKAYIKTISNHPDWQLTVYHSFTH